MDKKSNWMEFLQILENNGISKLYHFTDRENLESIIKNGGLYSWADCREKGITIAKPGGSQQSRNLDTRDGLQHFVRLCFTRQHPMLFVAKNEGRIYDPIILEIAPEVVYWKDTKYADRNATKNGAIVGETLEDFKRIHFQAVKARRHFDLPEEEQIFYQAEVLVKNNIPIQYITNISNFGISIPTQTQMIENQKSNTAQIANSTPIVSFPTIQEYVEAIMASENNFKELRDLRPVLDDDGSPIKTDGDISVVFKMQNRRTGKLHAVKCFLENQVGRAEAYRMIADELEYESSPFLTPTMYLEKELHVDTNTSDEKDFPVLVMDWVQGITLDKYIKEHIDNSYKLSLLTYQFSRMATWLFTQHFAHGDINLTNIIVREDNTLTLVDYDGMYVPAMKGQKARELGCPYFQHPLRTSDYFNEHIDDFPLISILLSLKAISLRPELLELYGDSDRLLFTERDYKDLSACPLLDELKTLVLDDEFNTLWGLFLITRSNQGLDSVGFRAFDISRPQRAGAGDNYTVSPKGLDRNEETDTQATPGQYYDECQRLEEDGYNLYYLPFGYIGIIKDYKDALAWYQSAAAQGHARAQSALGLCYEGKRGVKFDREKAMEWYLKAAEQGNAFAQCRLGNIYYGGNGVEKDYNKAAKWYLKAAEQGNVMAQFAMCVCYILGRGVKIDLHKAAELYQKASEHINALSQIKLGICHTNSPDMQKRYKRAADWFRKVAEHGNPEAQYKIGLCYYNGQGVEKDYHKATKWIRKAAEQGHIEAQFALGWFYETGNGVEQDYIKAVEWYHKAAYEYNPEARYRVGLYYNDGQGVEKDYSKAAEWFGKAACECNSEAQYRIGVCFYNGHGVEQNWNKAVKWFKYAAEQNNSDALYMLGVCYCYGLGVQKDIEEAKKWFDKAIKVGNEAASKVRGFYTCCSPSIIDEDFNPIDF